MPEAAVLVCPGWSFNPSDLPKLHRLGDVYCVNRALRAYHGLSLRPKGVFMMDSASEFEIERPLIEDARITKYVREEKRQGYPFENVITIKLTKPTEANPDFNRQFALHDPFVTASLSAEKIELNCWLLTTLVAWQSLVLKGYKRIYIKGCDCWFQGEPYYCEHKDPDFVKRRKAKAYRRVKEWLNYWQSSAVRRGTGTFNLSIDSKLIEFMVTVSIDEALEMEGLKS